MLNAKVTNLESRSCSAEVEHLVPEGRQDGINRGVDCTSVSSRQKQIGSRCDDAHSRLFPDLPEGVVERAGGHVIDDLSLLHVLTGGDIQAGHVSFHVSITDDGNQT